MDEATQEIQYLERSQRIVRVEFSERLVLRSALGELPERFVENFECFRSQMTVGDFLLLERRDRDCEARERASRGVRDRVRAGA